MEWFYPKGHLLNGDWESVVDGQIPDWKYAGLRIANLQVGKGVELTERSVERLIVPLSGSFLVEYETSDTKGSQLLDGRSSVFDGPTDTLFLPIGTSLSISGIGKVAVAEARADNAKPISYRTAANVPIEIRGAGQSTRQVNNFGVPNVLDANRLIVCEVITPSGNWSSYPPHKHDEYIPGVQSNLEEIYYFEVANCRGVTAPEISDPIGYFRNYSSGERNISTLSEVRTGDIALVPFGWHGPATAAPGYDLYYLNVMVGPDPERSWLIVDDPNHAWVRQTWADQKQDSRLPYRFEE